LNENFPGESPREKNHDVRPMSTITLQPLRPDDAERFTDYLIRNREFHRPWIPTPPEDYYTVDVQRRWLETALERQRSGLQHRFAVVPDEAPSLIIGSVAINAIEYGAFRNGRISYMMDQAWTGRDIATTSIRQLMRFAFDTLELHRLEAHIIPRNVASRRVVEKCGFTYIGTGSAMVKINGVWEDHTIYAIINERHG
jgi:ribosomal-protein-alanine N-acetyltransferase